MVRWVTSCCPRGTASPFPLHYTVVTALTPGTESGLQYPASTSVLIGQCKCYKATFSAVFRSKEGKGEQTPHYLVSWLVPRRGNGSSQEKDGACQPKASTPPWIHIHQNQCMACWGNCSLWDLGIGILWDVHGGQWDNHWTEGFLLFLCGFNIVTPQWKLYKNRC